MSHAVAKKTETENCIGSSSSSSNLKQSPQPAQQPHSSSSNSNSNNTNTNNSHNNSNGDAGFTLLNGNHSSHQRSNGLTHAAAAAVAASYASGGSANGIGSGSGNSGMSSVGGASATAAGINAALLNAAPATALPSNGGLQSPYERYRADDTSYVPIGQFYAGRSVFITGGTGFMGKVLVEKLLRSCPDIRNIYLLIRPKRGQEVSARLTELLNAPLFESLRREKPKELSKVIPISGDITSEELGISESDQTLLCRNVSVVFHSAATVKFDEKLKLSVTINMLGTKRLVELCHRMMSLDALIHVSTAYCNCDRTDVSEVIYAPPYNPDDIISLINWLPEDILDQLTPRLIGKRPNTYTFTKALAEHMLLKEAGNLPVAIVRPSIVTASLNEPFAGWVDNFNGPTGLVSALAKGMFRTMMCEKNYVADMVPVDIVINLMIAAAWRTATRKSNNLLIYNCCTGQRNPIIWSEFVKFAMSSVRKHPLEGCLWYPTGDLRMNRPMNTLNCLLKHFLPAYILDGVARIMGKKPFVVNVQNKIAKAVECLEYFATRQWRFKDDNVHGLLHTLSPKDREIFIFDVRNINWDKYVERYVLGFREFLFKQRPESLPASRKRMVRLYYLHQLVKVVAVLLTWRFLMSRSKRLNDMWSAFLENALKIARLIPFL
ncbi:putative fatty acyl-CoA reductase CG5065 [Drosophila nasuta]|uniref:Fatty acyl-CoA reductase n=1 Tax=Drosophila albomicans TaxID=7291 RepID=A0A6P8WMB3_DROAB|nr:putative fatty acyl-CoA reductase CG5065 [Drosophila albomicans]XP_034103873.1 putative fatty acyl-CoA reductase CG5065 [Drosophila albomicans]XP_034103874.1 putative fatty acyl-CoA reductase CG5065 [Drosophila albomicans]XP_034103878.1 putative fatty acyl-CoA reductase CG5065 [Drosophila albomicans]XP_060652220.1 putative fatty acyl-CoA reductase CG5065 [Drosophila nasuta]XP_060652221.1 putative fatty acyl-CoA reductase CG5065 [Drosophila nasuta]XP_060652222.1 putative fatty acyl-CoA redu